MSIFFGSGDSCGKNSQQIRHAMLQQNVPRRETPASPSRPLGLPPPSWQCVLPESASSLPCAGLYQRPQIRCCARDLVQCRGCCAGWGHCLASRTAHTDPGWNLHCPSGSAFPSLLAKRIERVTLCCASTWRQDHPWPITRVFPVGSWRKCGTPG